MFRTYQTMPIISTAASATARPSPICRKKDSPAPSIGKPRWPARTSSFLTADHPVFLGALEQFLDSESGNASFAQWKTGEGKAVLLECAFVLEALAPTRLHLDRFLPPTVIRVVVDHQGNAFDSALPVRRVAPGDSRRLVEPGNLPPRAVSQDARRRESTG